MALTTWYRGVRFVKDYTVKYLNLIFLAQQKGSLLLTDGDKKIKFSRTPEAIKRASWDFRMLPAVLIGKATGGLKYVSASKDLLSSAKAGDSNQTYRDGGDFDLSISLHVRARSVDERDNLLDITCIYLAHPDAKDYYLRQGLILPEGPKIGAEREVPKTGIDYPIYETDVSLRVISRWQEERPMEERLLGILVDIETYLSSSSDGSETLAD